MIQKVINKNTNYISKRFLDYWNLCTFKVQDAKLIFKNSIYPVELAYSQADSKFVNEYFVNQAFARSSSIVICYCVWKKFDPLLVLNEIEKLNYGLK